MGNNSIQRKRIKVIVSNAKLILVIIILFCIIYCIPTYLYPQKNKYENNNKTVFMYYIAESDLNMKTNNLIFQISFYIQAIVGKILPCILLGVFIGLIRYNLNVIELNKENLINLNNMIEAAATNVNTNDHVEKQRNEHKRKTLMLLFVCLLLLIAELPQALLLLCSIFSDHIYLNIYKPLGDLLDVLVLITYPVNFFIYCSMSQLFRNEFYSIFNFRPRNNSI